MCQVSSARISAPPSPSGSRRTPPRPALMVTLLQALGDGHGNHRQPVLGEAKLGRVDRAQLVRAARTRRRRARTRPPAAKTRQNSGKPSVSSQIRVRKITQVERVDGEMGHHRTAQVARPQEELSEHHAGDEGRERPGQEARLGTDVQKREDGARRPQDRPPAGARRERRSPRRPPRPRPARGSRGPGRGPSRARRSRCKARPHSKRWVAKREANTKPSPRNTPATMPSRICGSSWPARRHTLAIPAQRGPGDARRGQGQVEDQDEGRPRPTSTGVGHRCHHTSKAQAPRSARQSSRRRDRV